MSLYDKYNVNPYIKTYVGAPVQTFQNTAGQLQAKYYDTVDRSNVMKQGLSRLSSMSGDKAYLEELKSRYEGDIEQMLESPELANRAVRTLAGEFMSDKDLQLIAKNKAAFDKTEKDLVDLKASHIQRAKFQDAIDRYNNEGGAAKGLAFAGPSVYEEQDLMNEFDKLVQGIKGLKSGVARVVTREDGNQYIETNNEEIIPVSKIRMTAQGLLNDPKTQRQLKDESDYHNRVNEVPLLKDGSYDKTHEKYRSAIDIADDYISAVEAKYYSTSDSSRLSGPKKGTTSSGRGMMQGGNFATITQFNAEDEVREKSWGIDPEEDAQEVLNQYNTAKNNLAAVDAGEMPDDYDLAAYQRDQTLIAGHNNAYKTAIVESDLKDWPSAREAVGNIPAEELFNMNNRPIDKEGASQALDNVVQDLELDLNAFFMGSSDYGNTTQNAFLEKINEQYGPEVAGALAGEMYPVAKGYSYNPKAVYPGFRAFESEFLKDPNIRERMKTEEGREEVYAETFGQLIENAKETIAQLPDATVDNQYGQERAKELLKQYNTGISDESVNDFAHALSKVAQADRIGTMDYKNALEGGAYDYGVDKQQVVPTGILTESTDANIRAVLETLINSYADDAADAPLDMIQVLDGNTTRPLSGSEIAEEIVDKYELTSNKVKVIGLDSQHGNGMIQIQLTPKAGLKGNPGPKNITVNLDQLAPDIRTQVANDALARYNSHTDPAQREMAYMVYTSFAMPYVKQELNAMFHENKRQGLDKFDTDNLQNSSAFSQRIRNAFGGAPLTPVVTPNNTFNFKRSDGNYLFLEGAASSDVALRMLMEGMQAAERRIQLGGIGTPINEPDSPDDLSNNTVSADANNSTPEAFPNIYGLQGMPDDVR